MKILEELTGRQRLLILVLIVTLSSTMLVLFAKGPIEAFLVSLLIVFILWLTKSIWLPDGFGTTLIRKLSLGIASAVLLTSTFWYDILNSLIISPLIGLIQIKYPRLDIKVPNAAPTVEVLVFLVLVIWIVNYFATDRTAMGKHLQPIDKECV